MRKSFVVGIITILCGFVPAFSQKAMLHYISVPIIEGCGIYSSVTSLTDANSTRGTQAAAVSSLVLMGTNSTLGILKTFGPESARPGLRTAHRIVGMSLTAAALWLSISVSVDKVKTPTRIVSYAYTGLTVVPIILFKF
jgi:hypothetical protein